MKAPCCEPLSVEKWEKEFGEFISSPIGNPPDKISSNLSTRIKDDLNPAAWRIFIKLALATFISGTASLLVCPQFGMGSHNGVMHFIMKYGDAVCSLACGAIFVGLGLLFGSLLLRPEEMRVLRATSYLQLTLIAFCSLGAFVCAGAKIVLVLAGYWICGAIIGGFIAVQIAGRLKLADGY